jgi:hypothetical protein
MPTERTPLVGEVIPTLADRRCHMVSVTDPYGRIFDFIDLEPLLFLSSSPSGDGVLHFRISFNKVLNILIKTDLN